MTHFKKLKIFEQTPFTELQLNAVVVNILDYYNRHNLLTILDLYKGYDIYIISYLNKVYYSLLEYAFGTFRINGLEKE